MRNKKWQWEMTMWNEKWEMKNDNEKWEMTKKYFFNKLSK